MSQGSRLVDKFTRRKVIAGGVGSTLAVGWLLTSLVLGEEESTTPTLQGSDSGNQPEEIPNPENQTRGTPTSQSKPQAEPTDSQNTPEPGPTNPGDQRRPIIEFASLLSDWKGGNQMEQNQINSISRGEEAIIGYRYRTVPNDDGHIQTSIEIDVAGQNRNRTLSRIVGNNTSVVNEHASRFETTDWSTGMTEATILARNDNTGYVSRPATLEFEVVER